MKEKFNESIVCLLWRGEVGTLPDISFGYDVVLRGLMLGFSSPGSRGVLFREIRKPSGSICREKVIDVFGEDFFAYFGWIVTYIGFIRKEILL